MQDHLGLRPTEEPPTPAPPTEGEAPTGGEAGFEAGFEAEEPAAEEPEAAEPEEPAALPVWVVPPPPRGWSSKEAKAGCVCTMVARSVATVRGRPTSNVFSVISRRPFHSST